MILQKYESYKDSGVEWLGKIPGEWDVKRNKTIFQEISDKSKTGEELLLTVSHITGVTPRKEKNVNMFFAETMEGYKLCKEGDLIINTMWAWMGALGISKYNGICSPAYGVYRCYNRKEFFPRYFEYLFTTPNFIIEMTRYSKGIVSSRLRLYPSEFYQIKTIFPKFTEQVKIAIFLDKRTSQIDLKIKLLHDKITSYEELKKTLINETVCRGLNKNVELKDTEIEWIGKIPKHWKVERLKDDFDLMSSGITYFEGTKEYLSTKSISNNIIEEIEETITYENRPDRANMQPDLNSIWFAKLRFTDKSYLFENSEEVKKYVLSTGFAGLLCNQVHKKFAYYYIISTYFLFQKDRSSYGTTQEAITEPNINQIIFIQPPKPEQIQIAKYLDEKTSKIDKIISKIDEQINTLTEFRKTLINDVVTGKVRVSA